MNIEVRESLAPRTQADRADLILRAFHGCDREMVVLALSLMEKATGKGAHPAGWLTPTNRRRTGEI